MCDSTAVALHQSTSDCSSSQGETDGSIPRFQKGGPAGEAAEPAFVVAAQGVPGCSQTERCDSGESGPQAAEGHSLEFIHGHNSWQLEPNTVSSPASQWDKAIHNVDLAVKGREKLAAWNGMVCEALRARQCDEDAAKLESCGSWFLFRAWMLSGAVKLRECNFCTLTRACIGCARIRAARTADTYTGKALALLDRAFETGAELPVPRLVTVTVPAGPDFPTQLASLSGALKRLSQLRRDARRRSTRPEWSSPEHFAWSVEAKRAANHPDLWHVHAHAVCLASQKLDLDRLHDEWRDISGASARPDVRLSDSGRELLRNRSALQADSVRQALRHDLMEVFKYALKFNELTADDVAEVYLNTKRKRLVFGWDGFRGCKVPEELSDLSEDLGPWMDLHFGRSEGRAKLIRSRFGSETGQGRWNYED